MSGPITESAIMKSLVDLCAVSENGHKWLYEADDPNRRSTLHPYWVQTCACGACRNESGDIADSTGTPEGLRSRLIAKASDMARTCQRFEQHASLSSEENESRITEALERLDKLREENLERLTLEGYEPDNDAECLVAFGLFDDEQEAKEALWWATAYHEYNACTQRLNATDMRVSWLTADS